MKNLILDLFARCISQFSVLINCGNVGYGLNQKPIVELWFIIMAFCSSFYDAVDFSIGSFSKCKCPKSYPA
eukprot:Pgem_evm1s5370